MQQLNLHTKSSKWPLFCSGSGVLQRRRCLENWEDVQEMYQQQGLQNEPCFNLVFVEMHLYTPVTPVHKFICPVTHGECCDRSEAARRRKSSQGWNSEQTVLTAERINSLSIDIGLMFNQGCYLESGLLGAKKHHVTRAPCDCADSHSFIKLHTLNITLNFCFTSFNHWVIKPACGSWLLFITFPFQSPRGNDQHLSWPISCVKRHKSAPICEAQGFCGRAASRTTAGHCSGRWEGSNGTLASHRLNAEVRATKEVHVWSSSSGFKLQAPADYCVFDGLKRHKSLA